MLRINTARKLKGNNINVTVSCDNTGYNQILNMVSDHEYLKRGLDILRSINNNGTTYYGSDCTLFGEMFSAPNLKIDSSKNDFMPTDVKEIIINDEAVIVILKNGKKGTATVDYMHDTPDPFVGFCIAYYRAHNSKVFRLKEALRGCVEAAKRKGYKNAILKNYDEPNPITYKTITNTNNNTFNW